MNLDLIHYEAPTTQPWQGRNDSLDGERFFQHVQLIDLLSAPLFPNTDTNNHIALLGFCSDVGIQRNGGRLGAALGPNQLREQLAKLACHHEKQMLDLGNIHCNNGQLEQSQHELSQLIHYCHQQGYKTLAFGGGHEIAWGHFNGLTSHYPNLGIINFDAHFDLRPVGENCLSTSGTPFRQIAEECSKQQRPFDYCCIGIQALANTASLFASAQALGTCYLTAAEIGSLSLTKQIQFLEKFIQQKQFIYLSICLDVLAECFAPGVSAPQSLGLSPGQIIPLLQYIIKTGKVVSFDIAELSPPLDEGQKTARLAANLIAPLLEFY